MDVSSFNKAFHHNVYDVNSPARPEFSAGDKIVLITGWPAEEWVLR